MAVHDMLMAAAGGTAGAVNYIDDVFSTYLYTGDGANQNIVNGMDFVTNGGLCWVKSRSLSGTSHCLADTARGNGYLLYSNETSASQADNRIESLNSNGFSVKNDSKTNASGATYVSWSFLKKAKFFDIVTYTGTGSARTVSHNLGSTPGCIIVKRTDFTGNFMMYHRSHGAQNNLSLNTTANVGADSTYWNDTEPTSTVFTVGTNADVNANGGTYVAYLFAHNAGGFGAAGTDNVISCGVCQGEATVNLGFEPQWILIKRTNIGSTNPWNIIDSMRGMVVDSNTGGDAHLSANLSAAETDSYQINPTATGFIHQSTNSGNQYTYIAIRRPMKPPTTGTEVFNPQYYSGTGSYPRDLTTNFPVDMTMFKDRLNTTGFQSTNVFDRLRGASTARLQTTNTDPEDAIRDGAFSIQSNTAIRLLGENLNYATTTFANYNFKRAPGFFDVVCYTGTGSARTINHNLGVVPELVIIKERPAVEGAGWRIYQKFRTGTNKVLGFDNNLGEFNDTNAFPNSSNFSTTTFSVGTGASVNSSASYYVAYLFATLAGISKVGSYTGTGTTKQIDCGFTGGARFVMIKRTDSTGDWYVWDSARGIVSGNDPYLLLNSTAAETTSTDYIDPYSAGFEISSTAPAAINASGGTYIYLAIA